MPRSSIKGGLEERMNGVFAKTDIQDLIDKLEQGVKMPFELKRLEPLFRDQEEYNLQI